MSAGLATPQATTPHDVVQTAGLATPQATTPQADVVIPVPEGLAAPQATTPQADVVTQPAPDAPGPMDIDPSDVAGPSRGCRLPLAARR